MIIQHLTNDRPSVTVGSAHKEDFKLVSRPDSPIAVSFNLCNFECPYVEPAFAELGTPFSNWKNDKTDLLFQLSTPSDTVELKLFKCEDGVEVEQAEITNNLYGTYFPTTYFPDELKIGFLADWNLILNEFGHGRYLFRADTVIVNQAEPLNTWFYDLSEFSEEGADGTVRIETNQNGFIEGGIDYTDFVWFSEQRFKASWHLWKPTLTKTHYQDQDRFDVQNRDSVGTTYELEIELAPYRALKPFIEDKNLANDMFISSYNLRGSLPVYQKFNVVAESFGDPEENPPHSFLTMTIEYKAKRGTPVKTNQ